jgi:hypothetical protein
MGRIRVARDRFVTVEEWQAELVTPTCLLTKPGSLATSEWADPPLVSTCRDTGPL